MADSGIEAIDRLFDLVDNTVEKVDRVLNRAKYTKEQHVARRSGRGRVIDVDTAPSVKISRPKGSPRQSQQPSPRAAPSRRFRIVEAIAAESGQTIFVVTDGNSRAECSNRDMAERLLRSLESSK